MAELQKAFEYYQSAAKNRDNDPNTYEGARIRYYALKNGEGWLQQEKARIESEKIDPALQKYRDMYEQLENEANVQKAYTDSISSIRDHQSSIKHEATKNTSFLQKLLEDKQTKLSAYNRYIELTSPKSIEPEVQQQANPVVQYFSKFPSSFTIILDVFIAFLVLFTIILVIRKTSLAYLATSAFWKNIITSITTQSQAPSIVIQSPMLSPVSGRSRTTTITPRNV
ncbi:MAG: hypothetical protein EBS86_07190 [Crocinitomicaceae bacterium]|nr:hypothetical protein [Crocinitomicaceae bacterium]